MNFKQQAYSMVGSLKSIAEGMERGDVEMSELPLVLQEVVLRQIVVNSVFAFALSVLSCFFGWMAYRARKNTTSKFLDVDARIVDVLISLMFAGIALIPAINVAKAILTPRVVVMEYLKTFVE